MNSLNIVSRLTTATPPPSPPASLPSSAVERDHVADGTSDHGVDSEEEALNAYALAEKLGLAQNEEVGASGLEVDNDDDDDDDDDDGDDDREEAPLLNNAAAAGASKDAAHSRGWQLMRRASSAVLYGVKVVFTTITAPGRYVIACFYDDNGHFSAIMPLRNLRTLMSRRRRRPIAQPGNDATEEKPKSKPPRRSPPAHKRSPSVDSMASQTTASTSSTDGEGEDSPARHTRSKATPGPPVERAAPQRKSIRIREHSEEALRTRKSLKAKKASNPDIVATLASTLKSPSSPAGASMKLTRYPRAPAPPRPLVPRRQPSYILSYSPEAPKKTLIIDLDETLIHSMAKGGRMSTGHMVEVRLGGPVTSSGIQIGPGVPILYYVHERPGCHDFLRKVCKWYNLVVFTASVQEYADPVIDYLERERKYFSGRYYRQHCTFRNGAYIKDLAQVEPDLSKVMILDNSPMSYIFHEDNAIPIEGWISDPTDNDLLHLVPLLEGLQYVTDVRALLALRQGQAQQA